MYKISLVAKKTTFVKQNLLNKNIVLGLKNFFEPDFEILLFRRKKLSTKCLKMYNYRLGSIDAISKNYLEMTHIHSY